MAAQKLLVRTATEAQLAMRSLLNRAISLLRTAFWPQLGYRLPAPASAKRAVLARYGSHATTWVETGTYFGQTTKWLASIAEKVVTIEPEMQLAIRAARRMSHLEHVEVIHGFSETVLPLILTDVSGSVSFWLDGHFSGGVTALGSSVTPIETELAHIERHLGRMGPVTVFVDDFRLFESSESEDFAYPPRALLVKWAKKNKLSWTVEHDIFVASTRTLKTEDT